MGEEKNYAKQKHKNEKKENIDRIIKNNLWNGKRKKKKNRRLIKNRALRDNRTYFEQQQEDYYKPKRVSNFWDNYIEYQSNDDTNRNLSLHEYLDKIKTYGI